MSENDIAERGRLMKLGHGVSWSMKPMSRRNSDTKTGTTSRPRRHGDVAAGITRNLTVVAVALALSCAAASLIAPLAAAQPPATDYVYDAGDRLRVTVYGEPDLSGEYEVNGSGNLNLPLIGEIDVGGLDNRALTKAIAERYKDGYLKNPRVSVEVIAYRPFFILGDVRTPGSYPYSSGMTVMKAIALSGGYFMTEEGMRDLKTEIARARQELEVLDQNYYAALADEARLNAERQGLDKIEFPDELLKHKDDPKIADIIESRKESFVNRQQQLDGEIQVLQRQINQYKEEITSLQAQANSLTRRRKLIDSEIADVEKLLKKGYARKPRLSQLQREAEAMEGERRERLSLIARAKQNISEVEIRIINLKNARINEVVDELARVRADLSRIESGREAAQEVQKQAEAKLEKAGERMRKQDELRVVITRDTGDGPADIVANDKTEVFPGDIIKVP